MLTSADYSLNASVNDTGATISEATSGYLAKGGYIGQLFEVVGVLPTAAATTVNEGITLQLGVAQLLDDATLIPFSPSLAVWSVDSGPISTIDAGGLATVAFVRQDTPSVVRASYQGFSGTLALTVLNANTDPALSGITATSATLIPTVNPNGVDTMVYYQYGTTDAYGSVTPGTNIGSGLSPVSVTMEISGLQPNTTYHYQLVTISQAGTFYGTEQTFSTAAPVPAIPPCAILVMAMLMIVLSGWRNLLAGCIPGFNPPCSGPLDH